MHPATVAIDIDDLTPVAFLINDLQRQAAPTINGDNVVGETWAETQVRDVGRKRDEARQWEAAAAACRFGGG